MSHFTVAVITKNKPDECDISDILAPYDENLVVEQYVRYTKTEIIKNARKQLEYYKTDGAYAEYLKDPEKYEKDHPNPEHLEYVKEGFMKKYNMSDEELYKEEISYYDEDEIDENGGILSTYNPKSKWDWYSIGGRWSYEIPVKEGVTPSDTLQIKDIEFGNDITVEEYLKKNPGVKQRYDDLMSGKDTIYNVKYLKERYPSLEVYVEELKNFVTFAIITPDGEWHEQGKMGWFGMSTATPNTENIWTSDFYDKFISKLPPEYYFTLVDCHI